MRLHRILTLSGRLNLDVTGISGYTINLEIKIRYKGGAVYAEDKKLSTAFFVLVLFLTLSAPAMAAAAIDTTHPVSLTISYQQDGKPIPGVPFALYRVADVNAYAEFTLSGDFKTIPSD